jgi:hypothetical protein
LDVLILNVSIVTFTGVVSLIRDLLLVSEGKSFFKTAGGLTVSGRTVKEL